MRSLEERTARTTPGAWPQHYDIQHPCCATHTDGETRCGLWCGHNNEHIPYTPGEYLAPQTLHPLTIRQLLTAPRGPLRDLPPCPICQAATYDWYCHWPPALVWRSGTHPRTEVEWRFWPCGCEAREIVPSAPDHPRDPHTDLS